MKASPFKKRAGGFTLIELLTAMAILTIIALMMAMIFAESDRIWFFGTGRAGNCASGRAALNLISHDLQYAVADDAISFIKRPDRNNSSTLGFNNDEICFVSLQHDSSGGALRTAREIHYYITNAVNSSGTGYPGTLMQGRWTSQIHTDRLRHCYFNSTWYETGGTNAGRPTASAPVIDNVTALRFYAATNAMVSLTASTSDTCPATYRSTDYSNCMPLYVDVFLEVLDDLDAERVATLLDAGSDDEARTFAERKARRYTTRIYFQNKWGYKPR